MKMRIMAKTVEDTFALGEGIGHQLEAGDTVLLHGELGAGKTVISQGIAKGLGIKDVVTSPTFTIVNEYPFKNGKLIHMDQYRITPEGFYEIGLDEYWDDENIIVVEWPREVPENKKTLNVTISYQSSGREILIQTDDEENGKWEALIHETSGD